MGNSIIGKECDSLKQTAIRLCTILLCAMLALSFVCVALLFDHDCTGEDCSICLLIDQSRTFQTDLLCSCFLALLCGSVRLRYRETKNAEGTYVCRTLFDLKVELLD